LATHTKRLTITEQSLKQEPSEKSQSSVAPKTAILWVKKYYEDYPIGGGWQVTDIKEESNRILVRVLLPDNYATGISSQPRERQARVISVACPNKYEEIWKLLSPKALVPFNVRRAFHEQFFWTSRLERVMRLLRETCLSAGGDQDSAPHTMPLWSREERRGTEHVYHHMWRTTAPVLLLLL
jgi:hypothetical protein